MTFALVAVFVLYGLLVLFLYIGWVKAIARRSEGSRSDFNFISIVVPVRNEENTIGALISDLTDQNYPDDKLEIIFVDDDSDDHTPMIINDAIKGVSNCSFIKAEGQGKKSAITTGVQHAKGEIIITTDGDCRVSKNWLQSFNLSFENDSVKMVTGAVKIETNGSFFSSMQSVEFASLIGSGAATLAFGVSSMCNGANLAFRKKIFQEVDGYKGNETIPSGDDEFLMRKVTDKYPDGIRFNNLSESVVLTSPSKSLIQFISQRLRWAGKWMHHKDVTSKILALYVFTFHAFVLMMPAFFLTELAGGDLLLSLFLMKVTVDFVFLYAVTSYLKTPWNWFAFFTLQLVYSFYAVGIGITSFVIKPSWKGRK